MIRIAVCDDEQRYLQYACDTLAQYAAKYDLEIETETFDDPSLLLNRILSGDYFVVYLLDIYMPGMSGMSIATELRSRGVNSPIIFLTSSTDHAVEAFGVDATHYLLKPYNQQSFFGAMDKAVQNLSVYLEQHIVLKVDGEHHSVSPSEIIYCEAEDKYQRLHLTNGKELLSRMTVSELFDQLESFACFHRCGRAYIINLTHLSKVTSTHAVLRNGIQLPLSRTAVAGLRSAFFDYFC